MKKITNQKKFLKKAINDLEKMANNLENLKTLNEEYLNFEKSIVFCIDINNGFALEGLMSSERVKDLINNISIFLKKMNDKNVPIIAYTDTHTKESIELENYPSHCLQGTSECEVVDEIAAIKNIIIKEKNSTNGFLAYNPIKDFKDKNTFIIVGDCTDICIYQFAISLKTYLNQNNIKGKVIVIQDFVDTFDSEYHNADLMNVFFLNSLISNGVEVIKNIKI